MPTTSLTLISSLLATFLPTPEVLRLQSPLGRGLWHPEAHGVRTFSFYARLLGLVTKIEREFSRCDGQARYSSYREQARLP
jgi:hypothetical protein